MIRDFAVTVGRVVVVLEVGTLVLGVVGVTAVVVGVVAGRVVAGAARGVRITVVTATRGEAGEIHNRDDAEKVRHRLGEIREAEQRAALDVLGVDDLHYLGYTDSGM